MPPKKQAKRAKTPTQVPKTTRQSSKSKKEVKEEEESKFEAPKQEQMEVEETPIVKAVQPKKEARSLERRQQGSSSEGIDHFSKLVENLYAGGK